jgi:hypothetical protein
VFLIEGGLMTEDDLEMDETLPEGTEEDGYLRIEGAGMRWLRRLAEEDGGWRRLAGLITGLIGGVLIIAGGFFFYVENTNLASSSVPVRYTLSKPSMMLGAAIIIGLLLSWWWRHSYAGCIVSLIAGGLALYPLNGLLGPWVNIGFGAYLVYGGALLGITGGLVMLAERKAGMAAVLDWQEERISSLEKVVDAVLEVWEEADRLEEAMIKGEPVDNVDYDRASAEAERRMLDYHHVFEA